MPRRAGGLARAGAKRVGSRAARPPAFTLVEAVLAMAIAAILLGAMAGVVVTTTRATEQGSDRNARASAAAQASASIVDDLRVATEINDASATSVEFRVADRDGDGDAEEISYRWDPRAPSSLVKTVNGESASLLTGVNAFELSLENRARPTDATSATKALDSALAMPSGGSSSNFAVGSQGSLGLYIEPALPAGTTSYTVQSIRVYARQEGSADGILLVSVYQAAPGGIPSSRLVGYMSIRESSLSNSATLTTFTFTGVLPVPAGQGVVVAFSSVSGLVAADTPPGVFASAGGLLGGVIDTVGGVVSGTGSILTGALGGVTLLSRDAARLELITTSTTQARRRLCRSGDGVSWSGTPPTDRVRFELLGTVTTRSYAP